MMLDNLGQLLSIFAKGKRRSYRISCNTVFSKSQKTRKAGTLCTSHRSRLDAATSSGILKAKQKLGVTFNFDKLGGIDFTKFSKLTMGSA